MSRQLMLSGKVIIVTGGLGLIGRSIVKDIRSKGGTAISADIKEKTDLNNDQLYMDVTDEISIQSCVESVLRKHGQIDGLVNNAYPRTEDWGEKFEDIKIGSWRNNVDMQLNSCFTTSQIVLKKMVTQNSGSVVNIASIYGIVGNDFTIYKDTEISAPAAYSAIKGGIVNFSRYLASYYGDRGIRINCVSPGGIFNHQDVVFVGNYENKVPLKRMGLPEDIAPGVSFLLSDESSYITGHNLVIDGGWTAI